MIKISDLIGWAISFLLGLLFVCVLIGGEEKERANQCDYAGKTKLNGVVYECHKAQP